MQLTMRIEKTRANQFSSMILTLNNLFIACIPISNYNISYSNHIVHTYLYVDESIRSELCHLALIPYVMSPLYLKANMCGKGIKLFFISLLLQNESYMLVVDFSCHFNETCPIKFTNGKTIRIVKQSFDSLHPSPSATTKHATCIQFSQIT